MLLESNVVVQSISTEMLLLQRGRTIRSSMKFNVRLTQLNYHVSDFYSKRLQTKLYVTNATTLFINLGTPTHVLFE